MDGDDGDWSEQWRPRWRWTLLAVAAGLALWALIFAGIHCLALWPLPASG